MDSTYALLQEAIDSANEERLRETLHQLCASSTEAFGLACGELLLEADTAAAPAVQPSTGMTPTSKRKRECTRQRYETCEQCDEEYDVSENCDESCVWHKGELEVDWDGDFWADHDENCHGRIDTEESREEYPEGFIWSCCDELGDKDGCMTTAHRPEQHTKKARH